MNLDTADPRQSSKSAQAGAVGRIKIALFSATVIPACLAGALSAADFLLSLY